MGGKGKARAERGVGVGVTLHHDFGALSVTDEHVVLVARGQGWGQGQEKEQGQEQAQGLARLRPLVASQVVVGDVMQVVRVTAAGAVAESVMVRITHVDRWSGGI